MNFLQKDTHRTIKVGLFGSCWSVQWSAERRDRGLGFPLRFSLLLEAHIYTEILFYLTQASIFPPFSFKQNLIINLFI